MSIAFTSDMHLGHGNIIKYCNRPFKDAEDMNEKLIRYWNERVKQCDTVYHLGDFCCYGNERGVEGTKTKAQEWEEQLNGKLVFIKGNHDANNTVKYALDTAVFSTKSHCFFLLHRPPHRREEVPNFCDAVLCGHVHEKWGHMYIDGLPVINVGTDQHNYRPLFLREAIVLTEKLQKEVP